MRWRVLTACPLLCVLAGWLAAGCGHAAAPDSALRRARAELVQAHDQVQPYADTLAAAVRRTGVSRPPTVRGSYGSCPAGRNLVRYSAAITVTADGPATMSQMSREIAGILRGEGWHLVSVNFARVHLALADTDHPLYFLSQHGMNGAANILPYGRDSAGALIFMHSTCVNAGSLAARIRRSGGT